MSENVYFLDEYRRDPAAMREAMRRHPCNQPAPEPRWRLTRRGKFVANSAACIGILAFCSLMGFVGYVEGL